MKLIEWEVNEDDYQEQIVIPEAQSIVISGPKMFAIHSLIFSGQGNLRE